MIKSIIKIKILKSLKSVYGLMQYKIILIRHYTLFFPYMCLTFLEMKLVLELSFRYFMFWV